MRLLALAVPSDPNNTRQQSCSHAVLVTVNEGRASFVRQQLVRSCLSAGCLQELVSDPTKRRPCRLRLPFEPFESR